MTVEYSGHFLRTRRQVLVQTFLLALVLLPMLTKRIVTERPIVSVALAVLTLLPFLIVHKGWFFLEAREKEHTQPTPEMDFAFHIMTALPMAMAAPLMTLLFQM